MRTSLKFTASLVIGITLASVVSVIAHESSTPPPASHSILNKVGSPVRPEAASAAARTYVADLSRDGWTAPTAAEVTTSVTAICSTFADGAPVGAHRIAREDTDILAAIADSRLCGQLPLIERVGSPLLGVDRG
jgi:hypothetical protein